jgi:hypothetical protein
MKPRIQCVLAPWIPGFRASGSASGGRRLALAGARLRRGEERMI